MANITGIIQQPKTHEWETPQPFFNSLNADFGFTLDAAASEANHKCDRWFGPGGIHEDGLLASWSGETVWCNPPYGREIQEWVAKGFWESRTPGTTVVMLIPSRTETAYWHDYVMRAATVRFVRGRLRFSGYAVNAPFPSAVVVFPSWWVGTSPIVSSLDRGKLSPEVANKFLDMIQLPLAGDD